jgi:hypothetical protein
MRSKCPFGRDEIRAVFDGADAALNRCSREKGRNRGSNEERIPGRNVSSQSESGPMRYLCAIKRNAMTRAGPAVLLEIRKILAREQKPDGSSLPGSPLYETVGFKCEDHLVHGRRAHPKIALHVGLGGGLAFDLAVVVNEREILTLFVCEGFCGTKKVYVGCFVLKIEIVWAGATFLFEAAQESLARASERLGAMPGDWRPRRDPSAEAYFHGLITETPVS